MRWKWFYIVSFSYIVDFLILPCTYIAFALDNYSVLTKCRNVPDDDKPSDKDPVEHIKFEEISVGAGVFIVIAAIVHFQHYNKMKWPAWIVLMIDLALLIAFIIGASMPKQKS